MKLEVWIKCKAGSGKKHDNPGAILVEYVRDGEQSARRSLKHKGFSFLTSRKVLESESVTEVAPVQYRHTWSTYTSWAKFIDDENKFELPEGWLEEIEGYRKIYKSLDKDPNQIELNMDTGLIEFV
ncbi:MAG: hypothetical protein WAT79_08585 [Saprospiraceae bacterium]